MRAAPRIPAPQQVLEPEQTTVVSFTDEDEAPTPAQSPEQAYDSLDETTEAARDAAQWRRRAADLERQVLALQRENAALRVGARPPWAADQAPAPGPALGSSAALDSSEQTAGDQLLFSDDAIFDIGDEDQNENAWAWPDTFGLGCCLAPEPTTPATPGVRFVSKGKRQRVPEDDRESGR